MEDPSEYRLVLIVQPDSQRFGNNQPEPGRNSFRLLRLAFDSAHHAVRSDPSVKVRHGVGQLRPTASGSGLKLESEGSLLAHSFTFEA